MTDRKWLDDEVLEDILWSVLPEFGWSDELTEHTKPKIKEAKQAIKDKIREAIPERPMIADKTPQPVTKQVVETGFAGEIVQTITQDGDRTYTAQDEENARFECAKPYLDMIRKELLGE